MAAVVKAGSWAVVMPGPKRLCRLEGVISGGLTRGLLRGNATVVDGFSYPEANVPCGQPRDVTYSLNRLGRNYLWAIGHTTAALARTCMP